MKASTLNLVDLDDLMLLASQKNMVSRDSIRLYTDFTGFLCDLFRLYDTSGARVVAVGHVEPSVEIAADRAGLELIENIGASPFVGDVDIALKSVSSPSDIIYAANPNRVTGANFSVADLQRLADAVPDGIVLIDEYHYEFFGITAAPLLTDGSNLILLRSFGGPFGMRSSDAGYIIAEADTTARIDDAIPMTTLNQTHRKTMLMALTSDETLGARLREIHDESLRLATELNRLGVQCRLTAADFLLLRVKDPTAAGNELARAGVPIDNLDGYPAMKNYLRYRIRSSPSNDRMLEAFRGMAPEQFRMKTIDRRALTMRLKAHKVAEHQPPRPESGREEAVVFDWASRTVQSEAPDPTLSGEQAGD